MRRFWETVIGPIFEMLGPQTIVEIGSARGGNTEKILDYCGRHDAVLHVIDPSPKYDVDGWRERYGERLVFHEDLSLRALPAVGGVDAALIDGDHNWHTVFNELKLIAELCEASGRPFPFVALHDVGWPYGRRDLYYDPETVPKAGRHPHERKGMYPGSSELVEDAGVNRGLNNAAREGTPRNGVLTAVEDFLAEADRGIELVVLPGLHGLGMLIPAHLRESEELAGFLDALEMTSAVAGLVGRIEDDRLGLMIDVQKRGSALWEERRRHKEEVRELRKNLRSYERRISRLRRRVKRLEAETERLAAWVGRLDAGVAQMLNSRRWRLGRALAGAARKALKRPTEPAVPNKIRRVRNEFAAWQARPGRKETAERGRDK